MTALPHSQPSTPDLNDPRLWDRIRKLEHDNNQAAARIEELEAALREILQANQIQTFRTIEVDPAGNTMAVYIVDGSCAQIARAALNREAGK